MHLQWKEVGGLSLSQTDVIYVMKIVFKPWM